MTLSVDAEDTSDRSQHPLMLNICIHLVIGGNFPTLTRNSSKTPTATFIIRWNEKGKGLTSHRTGKETIKPSLLTGDKTVSIKIPVKHQQ